jgi:hypothetical protein
VGVVSVLGNDLTMVRQSTPSRPEPANLSPHQIKMAIPALERRIAELSALNLNTLTEGGTDYHYSVPLFQPPISARVLIALKTNAVATKNGPRALGVANLSETISNWPREAISPNAPSTR